MDGNKVPPRRAGGQADPGSEWTEKPFEEVIDFREGPGILAKDFREDGVPLVRLAGLGRGNSVLEGCNYLDPKMVAARWDQFRLERGDILLSTSASLGRIAVVGEEGIGAVPYTGIIRMRPKDITVHLPFIRYLLEGPDFQQQCEMVGVGSVIRHFGPMHLKQMTLKIPPLPEQRDITRILGTLDDKIELNQRMNRTLEEMARAIFQDWFVDFGPTRAKMEGLEPYLPPELWDLFPEELMDSELGEVPEGWELRNFESLLDDVIGGDWGKDSASPPNTNPVSIIRGTDVPNLRNGSTGSVPIRFTTEKKAERRKLEEGDIIIEVSGGSPTTPTGRSMIMTTDILERFKGTVVCASFCRRFRPSSWTEGVIASQHLDYLNSIGKMWEYQLQSTGLFNFQTKRFLEEEQIIWPRTNVATAFVNAVSPLVRATNRNESITLAETPRGVVAKVAVRRTATRRT